MWPHFRGLLRQVSARVLRGESSHLRAKRKMCSTEETVLQSLGVNILINGTVSLGTPHLLEYFSGYLAHILQTALSIILIWALSGLRTVHLAQPRQQSHPNTHRLHCRWSSSSTRGKWSQAVSVLAKILPSETHNISTVGLCRNVEQGSTQALSTPTGSLCVLWLRLQCINITHAHTHRHQGVRALCV